MDIFMANEKLVVHPSFNNNLGLWELQESSNSNAPAFDSVGVEEKLQNIFIKSNIKSYRVDLSMKGFHKDKPPVEKFFIVEDDNKEKLYFYFGHCAVRRYKNSAQKEVGLQVSNPHYLKSMDFHLGLNAYAIGIYKNKSPDTPVLYYIFKVSEWFDSDNFLVETSNTRKGPNETSSNSFFSNHERDSLPALNSEEGINLRIESGKRILTFTEKSFSKILSRLSSVNKYFSAGESTNETLDDYIQVNGAVELFKPLLLLAGISGTGKSRFVREQSTKETFELVSVRPDWQEPSDLLGYLTRLGDEPQFVSTDLLKFIVKAWKEIAPLKEHFQSGKFEFKSDLKPFWLCLDEMNLAPVEQYFADYLSVLETRKIENGSYFCAPLIKASVLTEVLSDTDEKPNEYTKRRNTLAKSLGLESSDVLFECILEHGIPLPYNLIVAGTVNMDETTHGFSRKVIDRALTLDFGEFFPNDFEQYGKKDILPRTLTYPTLTQFKPEALDTDIVLRETREFLKKVNEVLKGTMFELAYRALNEALLMVHSFKPYSEGKPDSAKKLCAVWDDFLMMKVLPRIEGDEDKLAFVNEENSENQNLTILQKLEAVLNPTLNGEKAISTENHTDDSEITTAEDLDENKSFNGLSSKMLTPIWDGEVRPDLLREGAGSIECRSRKKIKQMQTKLGRGFTTFWP
jgi:hypothetical protein